MDDDASSNNEAAALGHMRLGAAAKERNVLVGRQMTTTYVLH
jgi:hypothetical protein